MKTKQRGDLVNEVRAFEEKAEAVSRIGLLLIGLQPLLAGGIPPAGMWND
ncbi:MAG TPA: hypothetical protein VIK93_01710 [Limnochordales bacterium]